MLPVTGQPVSLTPLPPPMVPDVHLVTSPKTAAAAQRLLPEVVEKRLLTGRS